MTAWATIYRDNFFRHSHWDAHHARAFWHERDRCARIVPPTVAKSREKHCREDARRFRIHVDRGVTRNYRPVHVSHPESCRLSRLEHFSLVSPPTPFFEFIGTKTDEWTLHYFVHDPAAPRILRNVIVNVHVYANEFFSPPFFFSSFPPRTRLFNFYSVIHGDLSMSPTLCNCKSSRSIFHAVVNWLPSKFQTPSIPLFPTTFWISPQPGWISTWYITV